MGSEADLGQKVPGGRGECRRRGGVEVEESINPTPNLASHQEPPQEGGAPGLHPPPMAPDTRTAQPSSTCATGRSI